MKAVIQRVSKATVTINKNIAAAINVGLLVFVGIENSDTEHDIEWLAGKISRLRIFNDPAGIMNLSLGEIKGEVMVVSQFTLHASTKKGNRPSYINAAKPEVAIPLYEKFLAAMKKECNTLVQSGTFGAEMKIELLNDGPVTIIIDTKNKI